MSPTRADGLAAPSRAQRDSPALCHCQSGMPPGLPMRPAPRTSSPVIGARNFLLHRGGAVDETTTEFMAHAGTRGHVGDLQVLGYRTQACVWSAAIK